jgi:hypothetical protein
VRRNPPLTGTAAARARRPVWATSSMFLTALAPDLLAGTRPTIAACAHITGAERVGPVVLVLFALTPVLA